MEIFHVLGSGCNLEALAMMDTKPNVLISAHSFFDKRNNYRNCVSLIVEKTGKRMVDSGFLAAAKKGDVSWADRQDMVLEAAEILQADYVAMMDIPMEPHILRSAGFVKPDGSPDFARALDLTYRNAEAMMKATTKAKKGFVNQGWTLEHRAECHRTMLAMGVQAHAEWWGIGSVCMRKPREKASDPPGLYEHAQWCRENIEGRIHCFGIAKGEWIDQLRRIGIDSCDSATATLATRNGEMIVNGGRLRLPDLLGGNVRWNNRMAASLYLWNMESIEYEAEKHQSARNYRRNIPEQGRFIL